MNESTTHQLSILIADENIEFANILREYINEQPSMRCCGVVQDGLTTIFTLERQYTDVLIVNFLLPSLDGLGVIEYCKEHKLPNTPVLILMGISGSETIMASGMKCGADYCIEKPFDLQMLVRRIKMLVEIKSVKEDINDLAVVSELLSALGTPMHRIGAAYMARAVNILMASSLTGSHTTMKNVYKQIAMENATGGDCVRDAISTCIHVISQNESPRLQMLLALSSGLTAAQITSAKLIKLIVQFLQKKHLYANIST